MAFVDDIRSELNRLPPGKSCCMLSEISALTQTSGTLMLRGGGKLRVSYRVESAALARRIFQLLHLRLQLTPKLHFVQREGSAKARTCVLTLDNEHAETLLLALNMMTQDEEGQLSLTRMSPHQPLTRRCCSRAFLRGVFLGAGSVTSPEKSYHLEWTADNAALRQAISHALEKNELPVQEYQRFGKNIFYLKSAQQISDTLALMGASSGMLQMENIRIQKQMRGNANRASNCDGHNAEKTANASARQVQAILQLQASPAWDRLPDKLTQLARLRLEHADLNLAELGLMMNPPLGKSGVHHRMEKLLHLAEEASALKPIEEATP